jgi:hypothetical protein
MKRKRRVKRNPISDLSNTEIALIVGGVAAVGIVGYLIYNANFSAGEQSAMNWADAQATGGGTGVSGLPQRGVGQFQQVGGGTVPIGSTSSNLPGGLPVTVITTDSSNASLCDNGGTAGYCYVDQENTDVPSVGDYVATVIQNMSTGDTYPNYGTVSNTDGQTVTMVNSQNIAWNFPLSYIATDLDLIGEAVGI